MSSRKCCVTHCSGGQPLHSFPNPKTNLELFRIWVLAIEGKIVGLEDDFIYENRRVCRRHFAANYLYAKSKLSKMAVPTLFLTGNTSDIIQPSSTTTNVTCVQPIVPEISSNPPEGGTLNRIPNPKHEPERLQEWRNIIGEFTKGLDDQTLYSRSRICHKHFEAKYWNRNNRLNRVAIPTLSLPDRNKIFKKPTQTAKPIKGVSLSNGNSSIPPEEDEVCSENIIGTHNLFDDPTDETSDEVYKPHIDSLKQNSVAVKYAGVQMSVVDIHICGECHSAFHFIQQFKEHKEGVVCNGISPYRDTKDSISNTWAFLLWKSSTLAAHVGDDGHSQVMDKWKKLPEKIRDSWITAGRQVFKLTKYANLELEPAVSKPVDLQNNLENNNEDSLLPELKSDHEEDSSGSVESEQDPLLIESNPRVPKWYNVPEEHSSSPLKVRKNSIRQSQLQSTQLGMKPCAVMLQDISKQLQGSKMPLAVKPLDQLMASSIHKHINADKKKTLRSSCSTIDQGDKQTRQPSKRLKNRASQSSQITMHKSRKISLRAQSVTVQSTGLNQPLTKSGLAASRCMERNLRVAHSRPRMLKSSKTCKKQVDVQSSPVANLNKEHLNPRFVNQQKSKNAESIQLLTSEPQELSSSEEHDLPKPGRMSCSEDTKVEKLQDLPSKTKKMSELGMRALAVPRNRPWRANFKIREKNPTRIWKLPSGLIIKAANPLINKMDSMLNEGTQNDEAKYKKVYYVMEKDKLDEGQQVVKATSFVRKYNEFWKKNKLPAALEKETICGRTQVKSVNPSASQTNAIHCNQVHILGSHNIVPMLEMAHENQSADQKEKQPDIVMEETQVQEKQPDIAMKETLVQEKQPDITMKETLVQEKQREIAVEETLVQEKQPEIAVEETQILMDTTNNETMATPPEEPSTHKQSEHTYSKCPSSTGPIVRKPVVRARVFPSQPILNNGIILTSWRVNNRYLEQTTVETPITSPLLTTDAIKHRSKKSRSKELEDQFFKDLGPLPPPSPELELTLCPLTGELLAPVEETEELVEEMIDGSALDEEHDISLPSMPILLGDELSFNE